MLRHEIQFSNDLGFDVVSMITCELGQLTNDIRYEYIYIDKYGWILCTILVRLIYYVRTWVEDIKID